MNSSEIETIRGVVHAWECDAVEHFTTSAYFKKLSSSAGRILKLLGTVLDDPLIPWTSKCRARFIRELTVGSVYHMTAGVVEERNGSLILGHRLFNSETGELCTTFLQEVSPGARGDTSQLMMSWDDRESERRPDADKASSWLQSSALIVRPDQADWSGRYELGAIIEQFTAANIQAQNAIGMSPSYLRSKRKGFSTAEYQLEIFKMPPGIGTYMVSKSAVVHVGRTSLWFVHELYNQDDNQLFARLGQLGVHLDLDTRRPDPLPDGIRTQALQGLKQEV
jgi:acyl-CoA thioesterase FadM